MVSPYYDPEFVSQNIAKGEHRAIVGGLWHELGTLQLDFLKSKGLLPHHNLLDIGCGSLRLGLLAATFLDAGNYWGTDLHEALLAAGYNREIIPAGLDEKLPRSHLIADGEFSFSGLPRQFDFAIAQSVFTHLPLDYLRLCLANLASHVPGPISFYATFFIVPEDQTDGPFQHRPGDVITQPDSDPYHHTLSDIRQTAAGLRWTVDCIGDWKHPRAQQIVCFSKPGASTAV